MLYEVISKHYKELFEKELPGLTSDSLAGLGIHVVNPNGDPNNPKAKWGFFSIIEHLDGKTVESRPISHEIQDASGGGTHIEGDSQNYTFYNDGLEWSAYHPCKLLGKNHDINSNTGHFAVPDQPATNIGLKASNNDLIFGFSGNDVIYGLTGNDTLYGGDDDDLLFGGDGDDILYGENGVDYLFGESGNDFLYGGAGPNYLEGGEGIDTIIGGDSADFAAYVNSSSAVKIQLTDQHHEQLGYIGYGQYGDAQGDILYSIEGIIGSLYNDTLLGDSGSNEIWGRDGNDYIEGGAGNDLLYGDLWPDPDNPKNNEVGNDTIYGGAGDDFINGHDGDNLLSGGIGNDTIHGGIDNDTIYGDEGNDSIYGYNGNNLLSGGGGDDTIFGGNAKDSLAGNAGTDFLIGGEGDDWYYFSNGSQVDHIIEDGTTSQDVACFVGISSLSAYKNGNNLILTANNNADQMNIVDWYINKGIDVIYFADNNVAYTAEYVASIARDITPAAILAAEERNLSINILDSQDNIPDIEVSGISMPVDAVMLGC